MTTRRGVLKVAGATVVAMGAGCTSARPNRPPVAGDRLVVELSGGLAVIDTAAGRPVIPASVAVASPDWTTLIETKDAGIATQVIARSMTTGKVMSAGMLQDRLRPRAVSPDGRLVALTTPAAARGRSRTTIVVADSSGQRRRFDLAGNLVPEAFSVDGRLLFVLDYLPPTAPDRYRVRAIDLTSGQVQALFTRVKAPVPPGAEEEMRGEGRQSVYGPSQRMLFTLYTHQPDHLHTRDLLAGADRTGAAGARTDKPHVHAFVHSLSLAEGWAFCIDLPAPFGEHPAAGHAITLGGQVVVVDAPGGVAGVIDPVGLTVERLIGFQPLPDGEAAATLSADGSRLLVGAGREVLAQPLTGSAPATRWSYQTPVRGLALSADRRRVYVGQTDQIIHQELNGNRLATRTAAPGLRRIHHRVEPTTR